MFEGKLPRPGEAGPLGEAPASGSEPLRTLAWDDLVARLSAARDLRAQFNPHPAERRASFDAGSAERLAHHNGKQPVNLEDSANGKAGGGTAERGYMPPESPSLPGAVGK